jgi:hypothetical protein
MDIDRTRTKIDAAKESLTAMLSHLRDNDLFALILFNEKATTLQPLARWADIDKTLLKTKIRDIEANCGTDLAKYDSAQSTNQSISHLCTPSLFLPSIEGSLISYSHI